jgi:hypothetical protein
MSLLIFVLIIIFVLALSVYVAQLLITTQPFQKIMIALLVIIAIVIILQKSGILN